MRGFLLIELVCALALLSVISLVMAYAVTTIIFLQHDALRRFNAVAMAHNHIESWVGNYSPAYTSTPTKSLFTPVAMTLTSETVATTMPGFEMVKVVVTWPGCSLQTHVVELYAGVARAAQK